MPKNEPVIPEAIQKHKPDWWDSEAWADWEEWRRKEKKCKITQKAANLQFQLLEKESRQGIPMRVILERSMANDWRGLFPLNKMNGKPRKHPSGLQPNPEKEDTREAMEIQADILDSIQTLRDNAELQEVLEEGREFPRHFRGALNIIASQIEKYEDRFNGHPLPHDSREWFEEVYGALRASDE